MRNFYCGLSITSALKDETRRDLAMEAIRGEILNMLDKRVMTAIHKNKIPKEFKNKIIPLHMFIKDKYTSDGKFDKIKARLVANGNMEDPGNLADLYSPTVNPITVLTLINIAAAERSHISSYDIKSAFLMKLISAEKSYYVKLPKMLVTIWVELCPSAEEYVDGEGNLYFKLNKYLYGLCEAPNRFNDLLH